MKYLLSIIKGFLISIGVTLVILPTVLSQQNNPNIHDVPQLDSFQAKIDFYNYSQWDSVAVYARLSQNIYHKNAQWELYVQKFNDIAVSAFYCNEIEYARAYLDSAKAAAEQYDINPTSLEWVTILQTQAACFYKKGNYTFAVKSMEQGIQRLRQRAEIDSAALQVAFISLSTFYKDKGDFDEGIEAAQRALQYTSNYKDLNVAALYNNLGLNYYNKFLFEEAYQTYQKAAKLYQFFLEDKQYANYAARNLRQVYNNIATNFSKNQLYDSALVYLKKGLKLAPTLKTKDQLFHNIAYAYYSKGQYDIAESYLWKSVEFKKSMGIFKIPKIADNHNLLGRIAIARGDYLQALRYLQRSLTAGIVPFDETKDIFAHPELYDLLSERKLLVTLELRGDAFFKYYEQSKDKKYLEGAMISYQLATQLIEQTRRSYKAEGSKRFLSERAVPIFEKAINTAHYIYQKTKETTYIEQAFELAEKSKAVLLLANLKEAEAKEFAGVHDTLIQEEQRLKAELAYNERQYQRAKRKNDTISIQKYQEALFSIGETYDYFIASLEEKYPAYYQLKYDATVASITDIQEKLLDRQSVCIEFFVGDSTITIFSISKEKVHIRQIPKPIDFDLTIYNFRRSLGDLDFIKDSLQTSFEQFSTTSHQLYQWLLDENITADTTIKRLIIIPDGIIGHLPFEVFLNKPVEAGDNFQHLAYLLHRYTIEYGYSGTFLTQSQTPKVKQYTATYGGFAARYPQRNYDEHPVRSGLADLPNAAKEVQTIADFIAGDAWVGEEASEERFKAIAANYQILHLSMHGLLDDGNPLFSYLLFTENDNPIEDDQLTVLEIYNMDIQADMAVLSACNTGFGQIDKGEGVMSLSRAFAYAGCPSMIMSLWSVPDQSTSQIMTTFFEQLKSSNVLKSEALRQAKLAYLEESDVLLAHPVFWAGFVSMGDTTPLQWIEPALNYKLWIGLGVLILGLVLFFINRKKS